MTLRALELKVPPVAVFVLCGAAAFGLRELAPTLGHEASWASAVALLLGGIGVGIAVLGVIRFVRVGTTVHPTHPSRASRVVRTGIYRLSRNPMYLGLALLLAALATWLSHPLPFLVVPAFVLYMNRFQIRPEERALLEKFGEPYAEYRTAVRRWI
ncbi:MAG TPA: isoprenylcysteine carboxylmethyltransferase family protein [Candidatus Polarisedimenticolaceae bacterium]